jgi:chemotaxis protein histidine kinase CheA
MTIENKNDLPGGQIDFNDLSEEEQTAVKAAAAEQAQIDEAEAGEDIVPEPEPTNEPEPEPEPEPEETDAMDYAQNPKAKARMDIAKEIDKSTFGEEAVADSEAGNEPEPADDDETPEGGEQAASEEPEPEPDKGYEIRKNSEGVDCMVLKVNGQEVLRPVTEMVRDQQKLTAADQRLEEASKLNQELAQWDQDLQSRELRLDEQQKALEKTIKDSSESLSKEDVAKQNESVEKFYEALMGENPTEAFNHLKEALGRGDATPPSDEEIQAMVDARLEETQKVNEARAQRNQTSQKIQQQMESDWNDARTNFMTEFPEIKQGSKLWDITNRTVEELFRDPEYKDKPFATVFREAGNRTRNLLREVAPTQSRTERKLTF